MVFENHIAYRFLTDHTLVYEMAGETHPGDWKKLVDAAKLDADLDKYATPELMAFISLVNPKDSKTFYVTDSVIKQFELLKVYKNGAHYDWSVFKHLKHQKITLILPENKLLRIHIHENSKDQKVVELFWLTFKKSKEAGKAIEGKMHWVMNYFNTQTGELCEHFDHPDTLEIEELLYKLMIFFYLTENTEEILAPKSVTGTKKTGKIKNDFSFPVIKVTSKWNVTSIRTEGFMVSGHWRLQPYKDRVENIFIEPFEKHGYKRTADKPKHV